jgi:predicted outer membrane protein
MRSGTFLPTQHPVAVQSCGRLLVRLANVFAALLLASTTAYTAGQLDIEAAQQALQKSKNKDVIAFAQDMERDHKAVNDKALSL